MIKIIENKDFFVFKNTYILFDDIADVFLDKYYFYYFLKEKELRKIIKEYNGKLKEKVYFYNKKEAEKFIEYVNGLLLNYKFKYSTDFCPYNLHGISIKEEYGTCYVNMNAISKITLNFTV